MISVIEALHHIAKKFPEVVGLKIPQNHWWHKSFYKTKTFRQMDHSADLWATYLFTKGFTKGEKALVMVPPGEDLLMAVFAMLRLGVVPVIIDPGMGIKNFINCAKKTKPNLFLGCPKAKVLYYILRPFIKFKAGIFLTKALKKRIDSTDFACHMQPEMNLQSTAAVLFTSGSTGYPKGAMYSYADFTAQIEALRTTFDIHPGEVDLPLLPVFSLYNPALGMTTVVPEMNPAHPSTLNPKKISEAILTHNVTNSFGSPRLWTKIVDYCEQNAITFPSIKRVFLAGAPVHPSLLNRLKKLLPNGEAFTPYGATEALPITYTTSQEVLNETYKLTLKGYGTCVGTPLKQVEIRIIPIVEDRLSQLPEELPQGVVGEIAVYAPYISKSYLNDPTATAKAKIQQDGKIWHRMGDLGYKDAQGRLWFCGRKIERVETPEKTFYTDCCEAIFNTHKDVFRSALIQFYTETHKIVPAIIIEPKQQISDKEILNVFQELRALAQTTSATQEIHHFGVFKKFPVDVRHNAKIHRLTLANYFQKHPKRIMEIQ